MKRREAKSKGEKERYKHLNAEFQTIARRDKKAFLSDQCKEIEENNRIGKTRNLFKKMRDTKATFHEKMSLIKDRNGMDLTIPTKGNAKECSKYRTIALISHASKVMLKILQARLQQYVNCELPDVQAGFRKARGTRN